MERTSKTHSAAWWWNRFGIFATLIVIAAGILLRFIDPVPVEALRLKTFDLYNRLSPREAAPNSPVVIVDIDEKSLAALGQWPWPRTTIADLLLSLRNYRAAVAGFDVVFAEPDRTSPGRISQTIRGADEQTLKALQSLPSNDRIMASAMQNFRTVLGQAGTKTPPITPAPDIAKKTSVKGVRGISGLTDPDPTEHVFKQNALVGNIPVLEESAVGRGIFSVEEEVDGVVRRVPVVSEIEGVIKPALTLEMLRAAFGGNSIFLTQDPAGLVDVRLQTSQGAFTVPVDNKGRVWVYFAKPDAFNQPNNSGRHYISAVDVIEGTVPPNRLAGKVAIVGTSAVGLLDIRSTPISPRLPGVEVHANLLETILTNTHITYPDEMVLLELAAALAAGLVFILLVPRIGPIWTLALLVAGGGTMVGASWYLFVEHKSLIDVTYPGTMVTACYAVLTFANYARDAAEKRQVRTAFGQYLSPDLVEQLADNPDQLALGGETKPMTLMFCDVRGFTTISEGYKDDPQGLTHLINRLLTPLTAEILKRRGTIDKYMGDCIMAFWNAPLEDPDKEAHACASALAMFEALDTLNAERKSEAQAANATFLPLRIGVGINTGDCVVGNMGSEQRFDYSVLGDAVNLASRLEGQSKAYGVGIVVGPHIMASVEDDFAFMELDLIAVKGKKEAVRIFTLLGSFETMPRESFNAHKQDHDRMLAAYRNQQWDEAAKALDACLGQSDGKMDGFYEIYRDRIGRFRATPPPEDWDGVFVATTK